MSQCDRCGKDTFVRIMSMFNTEMICLDCKDREIQHPGYKTAIEAELAAVRGGDRRFPGVGLPPDLEQAP